MPTDDEIRALVRDVNGEYYPPNALENTRRLFSIFRDPALPKSQRWLIRSLVYGRLNVMKNLCHALNELLPGEGAVLKYRRELWYLAMRTLLVDKQFNMTLWGVAEED
jgi:hypothetical protein